MVRVGSGPEDLPQFERLGTAFQAGHASDDRAQDLRALVWVLDAQEALPGFRRLRDWAAARLVPSPGETAVDVGCGTGAVVRGFAAQVGPTGRAVGVEPNGDLRAVAAERAAGLPAPPAFVDGDAYALPFEDASVDVLHCERVWQHLSDPARAATEVARVLRPGGRAAVLDSDWGTLLVEPGDPDVVRRVTEAFWASAPNPFSGRRLRGLLRRTGLEVDPDVGASAFVMPDDVVRQLGPVGMGLKRALETGAVSAAEAEDWSTEVEAAVEQGTAFMSVSMFAVVARPP